MTTPKKPDAKPGAKPAVAAATPAVLPDFVLKEMQTSADDALKLAYGSMTLPPDKFISLFAKVGEQYMQFVAKRLNAQAARMQALSSCTSPEDVAKTEMTFFGKAAQDYAEQFDRFAEVTHGAAKAVEDGPGKAQ